MQRLPAESGDRFLELFVGDAAPLGAGVDGVADDGVADRFQVDADLVCASRSQDASDY